MIMDAARSLRLPEEYRNGKDAIRSSEVEFLDFVSPYFAPSVQRFGEKWLRENLGGLVIAAQMNWRSANI